MQNRRPAVLIVLIAAVTIAIVPAFAQGRGRGRDHGDHGENFQDHGRGRDHGREHERERRAEFNRHDRDEMYSYYRDHRSQLPPGLARRRELPPGLRRQLRRNGELPPGLRRRIVWFPRDLDRRLPPLPDGYRRCWVGDNALVVNVRTFRIADVMLGISFHF